MYILPWHDIIISGNLSDRSGTADHAPDQPRGGDRRRNQIINLEPLGSTRLDTLTKIDVRVGKLFKFDGGATLEATVDFDNLTNAATVWQVRSLTPGRRRSSIRRPDDARDAAAVPVAGADPGAADGGAARGVQVLTGRAKG